MYRRTAVSWICAGLAGPLRAQATMQISTLLEHDPATTVAERVLTEAYKRMGINLKVLYLPGERSLVNANNGETDGELYRRAGIEQGYPNLLRVPVALMTYEIVAFARKPELQVQGWDSLRPYRLGFVKGIKIVEEKTQHMKVESVATMHQAFSKLELDRTDLVLSNRVSGLAALSALKFTDIHALSPPLASFPVYHYLNKRYEALLPRLTAVLREMERDKLIAGIQQEMLSSYGPGAAAAK
jgi:polar amino acid transport system substrate-binding protein